MMSAKTVITAEKRLCNARCLFVYLSVCLSVCLSVSNFT